ncbi:MAG: carbohydrate kinase family protein [Ignavibacteriae bacterium]|nr:carbohydrate kinase family protein [Ignavibacteriota bacterium]
MKILILGHLVLDEIHPYNGPVIESFGGIHFPVSAFGAISTTSDVVYPCFPAGADAWDSFQRAVGEFPCLDTRGIWKVSDATTRVRLFHDAQAQYNTQLVRSLGPIPFERFAPHLDGCDLVYINFMTGEDLTLDTAESLRAATRCLIYLDLHMIAYRVGRDGHRATHPVQDWRRWAATADVLQCNERELAAFVPVEGDERARADALFEGSGPRLLVVTRGERGATLFTAEGQTHIAPVPLDTVVDSTGCGDTFGSTLAYFLAKGLPATEAASRAARAGAFVATLRGSEGMAGLSHIVQEHA